MISGRIMRSAPGAGVTIPHGLWTSLIPLSRAVYYEYQRSLIMWAYVCMITQLPVLDHAEIVIPEDTDGDDEEGADRVRACGP